MPFLDDHATPNLRLLASGLSPGPDTPQHADAFELIRAWAGDDLHETDDAGTALLRSPTRGIHVRMRHETLASITFELATNPEFEAFADPTRLLTDLDTSLAKAQLRAVLGEPIESAYGNDWYLLDASDTVVVLTWRTNGTLQRLMLLASDDDETARLRRKAAKAAARSASPVEQRPIVVEVPEEDGILGIVDPDSYRATLPDWDFASLSRHLETESVGCRGAFWRAGPPEFASYVVEIRTTASDRASDRESEHVVRASAGRLRVVGYGTLTMAAESSARRLAEDPDADITVPAGRLLLRIRQFPARVDSDDEVPIEIVVEALGRRRVDVPARLAWWPEA